MTTKQAVAKLKTERTITTAMLGPLNIRFEHWLKWCQLPDASAAKVIEGAIKYWEGKGY